MRKGFALELHAVAGWCQGSAFRMQALQNGTGTKTRGRRKCISCPLLSIIESLWCCGPREIWECITNLLAFKDILNTDLFLPENWEWVIIGCLEAEYSEQIIYGQMKTEMIHQKHFPP